MIYVITFRSNEEIYHLFPRLLHAAYTENKK